MSNYNPTYLGEIELSEDTLAHFGVKGMKWGVIKRKIKNKANDLYKRTKKYKRQEQIRRSRNVGRHIADDVATGRYGMKGGSDGKGLAIRGGDGTGEWGRENASRFNRFRNDAVANDYANTRLINSPNENHRNYKAISNTDSKEVLDAYERQLAANRRRKKK